ncbi:hypothetical protein K7X08_011461 [Anisodus acutangulus]|uniref:Uncharacterized protein n=1 Tax=Anisodus acutangulus TaxID=402998 RepID=A0A9Q1MJK7_9SOLA|nr:hypothetical protein K7X08_011461 [Anisodus acutangulus]
MQDSTMSLLQLRENTLKLKQEVETELCGQDANRDCVAKNGQTQSRYSEPDTDDWCSKSGQLSAPAEYRSLDPLLENREICDKFYSAHKEANEYNGNEQLSFECITYTLDQLLKLRSPIHPAPHATQKKATPMFH